MSTDDYLPVCGQVCPDNRLVSCVRVVGHIGWCAGGSDAWPTPVPADWDRLGWFEDPEPLPERRGVADLTLVVMWVGALIVTVLLAAAFVALGGVL